MRKFHHSKSEVNFEINCNQSVQGQGCMGNATSFPKLQEFPTSYQILQEMLGFTVLETHMENIQSLCCITTLFQFTWNRNCYQIQDI